MAQANKNNNSAALCVLVLKKQAKVKEEQKVSFRTWYHVIIAYTKGEQRPTKATLKQVNYKIDFKVTKINSQLCKQGQNSTDKKKLSGTVCFGVEEETESERRTKSVLLNPKGKERPTKATLKQN